MSGLIPGIKKQGGIVSDLLLGRLPRAVFGRPSLTLFGFTLFLPWLAGVAYWWARADVSPFQRSGALSMVNVFVLAALVWLIALPFRPKAWRFIDVLVLVGLSATPELILLALPAFVLHLSEDSNPLLVLSVIAYFWRIKLILSIFRDRGELPVRLAGVAMHLLYVLILLVVILWNLAHYDFGLCHVSHEQPPTGYLDRPAVKLVWFLFWTTFPCFVIGPLCYLWAVASLRLRGR